MGDPVAVLPVLFVMLWRGALAADLDSRVLDSASTVGATRGLGGLMARHPVLRPGDTLRLGGETHTVAGWISPRCGWSASLGRRR